MLTKIINPLRKDLGGFKVARLLPSAQQRSIGPFVFFDHMGPAEFGDGAPRSADVRAHPQSRFSGTLCHRWLD